MTLSLLGLLRLRSRRPNHRKEAAFVLLESLVIVAFLSTLLLLVMYSGLESLRATERALYQSHTLTEHMRAKTMEEIKEEGSLTAW